MTSRNNSGGSPPPTQAVLAAQQRQPVVAQALQLMRARDYRPARQLLNQYLASRPGQAVPLAMLGETEINLFAYERALAALEQAIALAPAYHPAQLLYVRALTLLNRDDEALAHLDALPVALSETPAMRQRRSLILVKFGRFEEAIALYRDILARDDRNTDVWLALANSLNIVGEVEEAVTAYRRAIEQRPVSGDTWWSLSNIKTHIFTDQDLAEMETLLGEPQLPPHQKIPLHFALASAHESQGAIERAYTDYAAGNALRRATSHYAHEETTQFVDQAIETYTGEFYAGRGDWGCPAPDPIFVLGMPRSGSTLIEQILASHPRIEGTAELSEILGIVRTLYRGDADEPGQQLLAAIAELSAGDAARLGEEYLSRTRAYRKTDRPLFIDKMPNNWSHVGLIRLILPNARIIDARRHPLACCFSNFKQHFAFGQHFSYALDDMGHYYRDYVRMMRHFDAVQPGKIHRVINERLVDDPEREVRALLDFVGVEYDPACLDFHRSTRAIRTPSAGQVRRPLNRDGFDQWRAFEHYLDPLKEALGPILDDWQD